MSDPAAPPSAIQWAVFGGALAAALMGLANDATSIVARGRQVQHKVDGLLRYLTAFGEVRALTLAGDFDTAEGRSGDIVQISSPGQYLAWGMANSGRHRGGGPGPIRNRAATDGTDCRGADGRIRSSSNFPARLLSAQSDCAVGRIEAGTKTLAELHRRVGGHVAVFDPQLRLADAWLSAAQGHVSGAVSQATEAADLAKNSGQRAVEMLALHDAARFGDQAGLQRLVDVAEDIGGRLAQIHAAYAAAMLASDAAKLFCAAEQFEAIGALLSAADATAQSAALFKAAGDRRRAVEAAAAANRLAAACGGVRRRLWRRRRSPCR